MPERIVQKYFNSVYNVHNVHVSLL